MPTDWKQLKNRFQEILNYCTEASTVLNHDMLRPACKEAGKGIFDLIQNDVLDVDFNSSFKIEPIVYDMQDVHGTFYNPEYYDDYWLCVLGFLGKNDIITVGNKKLRDSKVPMSCEKVNWEARFRLESVEESFFSDDTAYLTETCRASIHACDYILQQLYPEVPLPQAKIELDVEGRRVKGPSGEWHTLSDNKTDILRILFTAKGGWVGGKEIPHKRVDKYCKDMPKEIQALIESHKQHGYRIPSLLPE